MEKFHEYFLGGVDDMAFWTNNIFELTSHMLENGTRYSMLPATWNAVVKSWHPLNCLLKASSFLEEVLSFKSSLGQRDFCGCLLPGCRGLHRPWVRICHMFTLLSPGKALACSPVTWRGKFGAFFDILKGLLKYCVAMSWGSAWPGTLSCGCSCTFSLLSSASKDVPS